MQLAGHWQQNYAHESVRLQNKNKLIGCLPNPCLVASLPVGAPQMLDLAHM